MKLAMNDFVNVVTPNAFFVAMVLTLIGAVALLMFITNECRKIFLVVKAERRRRKAIREITRREAVLAEQRKYDEVFKEMTMRMRT